MAGITALADHSLLRLEEGLDGASRYLMLETVREFGLEQLTDSGEEPAVRRAHAHSMTKLFEEAWTAIIVRFESGWLARLDAERDNVRSALRWRETEGDGEGLLRLAGAADPLWNYRSYRSEGRGWLDRALDGTRDAVVPAAVRMRALATLQAIWLATRATIGKPSPMARNTWICARCQQPTGGSPIVIPPWLRRLGPGGV